MVYPCFGSADVTGRVRVGRMSALLLQENFLKQCLKQGLLMHSEQTVKGQGGQPISPLCTVLKLQSVLRTYSELILLVCTLQAVFSTG